MTRKKKTIHIFSGEVVSRAGNKTITVRVDRTRMHPLYRKSLSASKRYLVHDEKNVAQVGQIVQFVPSRPLSARKRWRLVKVLDTSVQK